jgi:MerR family transcriptional regulator, light-induced transcriptional regulator
MNGPEEQMTSQDDDALECKAELPLAIATAFSQRADAFIGREPLLGRDAVIARSIEVDIIPRLLMAHLERPLAQVVQRTPPPTPTVIDDDHIARFADLVVNSPVQEAVEHISALVLGGTTLDVVFSSLFARTARLLGERWEQDESSFLDVTLGLANLQQLLRRFSTEFEKSEPHEPNGSRLLLASMPGEAHTFGMTVVEEYFRRDGWSVSLELPGQAQSLLNVLRESWFDVVGLSIGNAGATDELTQLIGDVRKASMNGAVRVIIGGCALPLAPEAITRTGADLFAMSAEEAVLRARQFLRSPNK